MAKSFTVKGGKAPSSTGPSQTRLQKFLEKWPEAQRLEKVQKSPKGKKSK